MTHVRRDWNVPVPEDTRYFMVNTLPGASSYAIGFLHPSELLIFKRLPSYQMNFRADGAMVERPGPSGGEMLAVIVAVALRSVRLCRYDLLADTG